jgi:hypothetical protein
VKAAPTDSRGGFRFGWPGEGRRRSLLTTVVSDSGAIKQPGADLAFELSDADRRGRPAEVLVFCQSQRVPQLPDIHTTTISKRYGGDPITVWPLSACRRAR